MAMDPSTLSTELQKIDNASTEPPVLDGWFDAVKVFWEEAEATPGPISPTPDASDAAITAMKSALTGISTPKDPTLASQFFSTAFAAFWSGMPAIIATVFPGAVTLTPPIWTTKGPGEPPRGPLEIVLATAFLTNKESALPKDQAYDAIAAAIAPFFAGATYVDSVPVTYTIA